MRVSFDLIKYKIIPNISDPFDLLEMSHTYRELRDYIHFMERKCPNPDCEDVNCTYGGFKVFLRLLNIIAGIESIDFHDSYHKCLIYQIRFILFPYKKRFALSYKKEYKEWNETLDMWTTFPSIGSDISLGFDGIMDRGSLNFEKEFEYKINEFDSYRLMQNMADLWCGNHKDNYYKMIFVSGVWKVGMPSWRRVKLEKK
jgi:hypothetical protein